MPHIQARRFDQIGLRDLCIGKSIPLFGQDSHGDQSVHQELKTLSIGMNAMRNLAGV